MTIGFMALSPSLDKLPLPRQQLQFLRQTSVLQGTNLISWHSNSRSAVVRHLNQSKGCDQHASVEGVVVCLLLDSLAVYPFQEALDPARLIKSKRNLQVPPISSLKMPWRPDETHCRVLSFIVSLSKISCALSGLTT